MSATRLQIDAAKKTALMKQNMREVAELLNESPPNESKARLRTEALIHDERTIEAYEILKAECDLLAERVSMIDQYVDCPADLVTCVSDVMFAAPRLSIREMTSVRRQFRKKYGRTFKNRAMANEGGVVVNPKIVTNLATLQPPTKAMVNLYMTKICHQHEVNWTPAVIELSDRHIVSVNDGPIIPVTTGIQQTDNDIVEGRPRNLTSLEVLPPPPPVAPGYQKKSNNNKNGNDTSSLSSDSSRDDDGGPGGGGGDSLLPVAMAYNATEAISSPHGKEYYTTGISAENNNHVSRY